MILKGSQRAGGKQLALHLLKTEENEHVEVHDVRGFVADDILNALNEAYAVSRGTRCKQFLFSLSLNPPETETVPIEVFEKALARIEEKLGLAGQPRVIVFHEKEARRHAHAVYSRIDIDEMKAINLPYFKMKLRDVSRELYLEHGWRMPRGLMNSKERNPENFSLVEYQQARRAKIDPKALKELIRECWAVSDSKNAFAQALQERGFTLARGDRRGHVALDHTGEIYSVARYAGVRTKAITERLGDPAALPSVEEAKADIAKRMTGTLERFIQEAQQAQARRAAALSQRRGEMADRHKTERREMREIQAERWQAETLHRSARLNKGLRGLWDMFTGRRRDVTKQNEFEALDSMRRDNAERDSLIESQLGERQTLQAEIRTSRQQHAAEAKRLYRDIARYMQMQRSSSHDRAQGQERALSQGLAAGPDMSPDL